MALVLIRISESEKLMNKDVREDARERYDERLPDIFNDFIRSEVEKRYQHGRRLFI